MNASTTLSLPEPRGRISITFLPGISSSESTSLDRVGDALLHLELARGRSAVVHRDGVAFVLDQKTRYLGLRSRQALAHAIECRAFDRGSRHDAVGAAKLEAVLTGRRQVERVKQPVDGLDRATAGEGDRAIERGMEHGEQHQNLLGHDHRERRLRDVEQGAVNVEEESPVVGGPR